MGGCYDCMKYLMVFINLIVFVISLTMIGLAIWMLVDDTFYVSMAVDAANYNVDVYMLLAGGILLLVVSFLGCCGVVRESQCMLISFFCVLLVILVAQIATVVWVYCNSDKLETMIRYNIKSTVEEEYYKDERLQKTFDAIQQGLKCCGADYPADWNKSKNILVGATIEEKNMFNIPKSCCTLAATSSACEKSTKNLHIGQGIDFSTVFENGCTNKVLDIVREKVAIVFWVAIAIIILEFIGLIFTIILAVAVGKSRHYKR